MSVFLQTTNEVSLFIEPSEFIATYDIMHKIQISIMRNCESKPSYTLMSTSVAYRCKVFNLLFIVEP